jgi:tryptophan synthase beta chain
VAEAIRLAPALSPETIILVNLSGRGDKDLDTVTKALLMENPTPSLARAT